MTFTAKDSLSAGSINGNNLNDDYLSYIGGLHGIHDQMRPLNMKYYKYERENKVELLKLIKPQLDSLSVVEFVYVTNYVKAHPRSPVSLFAVQQFAKPIANPPDYPTAFALLDISLQESNVGKSIQRRIADERAYKVGDQMPDFSQPDTLGKVVHLYNFKGKYILIDLWASWCGPCRMETPNVKRAFEKYKDKDFIVIMVSIDAEKGKWLAAIKQDKMQNLVQLGDMKDRKNEVTQLLKVKSIPQNFLVDPSGKIIGKNLHGLELTTKLEAIFNQ